MSQSSNTNSTLHWESGPAGALSCNGTIIWNDATRSAVLIDPTDNPKPFVEFIQENNLQLKEVLLTHGHIDHCAGVAAVARAHQLSPRMHLGDKELFEQLPQWGRMFGIAVDAPDVKIQPLEDGSTITVEDGFELQVRHTPGHSPGQVAFYIAALKLLVVGDTLFYRSVGRSDLPGGDQATLYHSIREILYKFPEDTIVVPGHGPQTTIGQEKRMNPFVRAE